MPLVALLLATSLSAAGENGLAVMNLKVEEGVSESAARLLNELILTEFQKSGRFEVFGQTDVVDLLDLETQKQLVGCDDASCMAEISGALGVDRTMFGSLGRLGDTYLLNLKLVHVKENKVEGRWSGTVSGEESELIDAAQRGVGSLLSQLGEDGASDAMGAEAVSAEEATPLYKQWWLWTAVGAVVVAGGVTAAVLLTRKARRDNVAETSVAVELPAPLP